MEDKDPPSPPSQAPVSDEEGIAASGFSDMMDDGAVGWGFSDGGGCEAFMWRAKEASVRNVELQEEQGIDRRTANMNENAR